MTSAVFRYTLPKKVVEERQKFSFHGLGVVCGVAGGRVGGWLGGWLGGWMGGWVGGGRS